jgi:Ca2+-binding EF-hand superfamily protein
MKKIFSLILVLGLLWGGNAYSDKDNHHKKHDTSDNLFKAMDLNNDQLISVSEFNQTYAKHSSDNHNSEREHGSKEELFKEMDLNKDNFISLAEFKEIYKKHSKEHAREEKK